MRLRGGEAPRADRREALWIVFLPGACSKLGTRSPARFGFPLFACPYVRSNNSELEASAVIPLPQLLERRWDELPFGPFDAQHRGRLVGDREPREGPLVVLTVLAHTAVVEVDGSGTWLGSRIWRWLVGS